MSETTARAHLQIGQVAERTELSIKTIRHYDEVGLVTPSARSAGGGGPRNHQHGATPPGVIHQKHARGY
uniref:MerR family DNA-binding transcriptional regulator n=1 Tax=Nocardia cyriacigeorgica TaxID=135487 RepID=UPI0024569A0D